MVGSNSGSDADGEHVSPPDSLNLSRRKLLHGSAAVGALLVGAGSASANGKGGQAVVFEEDYKADGSFVIREVEGCTEPANPDGSCQDEPLPFQCNGEGGPFPPGKGGTIVFPYWNFNYVDDPDDMDPRRIYTRDNSIRTGVRYRWTGKAKKCPDNRDSPGVPEDLVQTGFAGDNGNAGKGRS